MKRCTVLCSVLFVGLVATTAFAGKRTVIVLDRSGSMSPPLSPLRATGNTRCLDAYVTAQSDLDDFFAANPSGTAAIVVFGRCPIGDPEVITGFVGQAAANAALATVASDNCQLKCATALADTLCAAIDLFPDDPLASIGDHILAISTDGGENISSGPCSGFSDPEGPYAPGSWQANVIGAKTADFGLGLGPIVLKVRWWDAFAAASMRPGFDGETGQIQAVTPSDRAFFEYLADQTGGVLYLHLDNDPIPPAQVPTVSTWGMAVIALMLLVGGKLYFGRRREPQV